MYGILGAYLNSWERSRGRKLLERANIRYNMRIKWILGILLLTACSVGANKWEDSAYRWQMNSRPLWQIAAGYVDSSTITVVPGDSEYRSAMEVAAHTGDPYAQWSLAIVSTPYWGGEGTDEEIRKLYLDAYNTFKQIAENTKDPEALYMLSNYYEGMDRGVEGWSPVEKNLEIAFDLNMQAANAGFPAAQYSVGLAYSVGEGVEKNEELALEWQKKAALQGEAGYQESLGVHYCSGLDCDEPMEAIKWYEMAAKQGHRQAQRRLARMYTDSSLVLIHDESKAHKWFKECAMLGDHGCAENFAATYELGEGVPQNYYQAYIWLSIAKSLGSPIVDDWQLEDMATHLSQFEIRQAQDEAEEIFKTIQGNKKDYPYFF